MSHYCIYTDRLTDNPSKEHIFPLSLGGTDEFCIEVDEKSNNELGTKVDGKLANDFLVLFERDKSGAVGHSKKEPRPVVKSAKMEDGTPIQVTFSSKEGTKLYDLKNRKEVSRKHGDVNKITCSNIKIDLDIDLMFVAKVALAAGYYAYGSDFREHVVHEEFRKIMNFDKKNFPSHSDAHFFSRFHEDQDNDIDFITLKIASEFGGGSSVVITPSKDRFGVSVAVLGKFMGFISVPSNSEFLKNSDDYRYGHCMYVKEGKLHRCSFDFVRERMLDLLDQH